MPRGVHIASGEAPVTSMQWLAKGGATLDTGIDNLSISTNSEVAMPEPATLLLLATGLGAVPFLRRRSGESTVPAP